MDWKEILGQLKEDPELPEGEEIPAEEPVAEKRPKDKLRIILDKKGRKGKTATIIEGFTCGDEEVAAVAKMLRQRLGVGGSSRGGEILLQGDVAAKAKEILASEGYKTGK